MPSQIDKARLKQLESHARQQLSPAIAVGDVAYYRPLYQSTMNISPVVEIIPTHPEPLIRLEDGKILEMGAITSFLPAAPADQKPSDCGAFQCLAIIDEINVESPFAGRPLASAKVALFDGKGGQGRAEIPLPNPKDYPALGIRYLVEIKVRPLGKNEDFNPAKP